MREEWSLIVAKCERLPEGSTDNPEDILRGQHLTVLFKKSQTMELGIHLGTTVKIYPPWLVAILNIFNTVLDVKGMEHVPNIFMSFDKYLFLEVINILI